MSNSVKNWLTFGAAGQMLSFFIFNASFGALIGAVIGFAIYECLSARNAGEPNQIEQYLGGRKVSLKFQIGDMHIHLHHWINMLFLLLVLLTNEEKLIHTVLPKIMHKFCYGCCIGGLFQGLRYEDRLRIVWRCPSSLTSDSL